MSEEEPAKAKRVDLYLVFLSVITTVMIAGIPWAYSMHGRVTKIESMLDRLEIPPSWFLNRVERMEERLDRLENPK